MTPRHAVLLAERPRRPRRWSRYIDRFLMYYVRTADRLERTATWFNKLEGGIDHVRRRRHRRRARHRAELEADMERHVATYECEWKATVDDPGAAGAVPVVRQRRRARSVARVRAGARSAAPRPATRARRPRRAAMTSGRIETESDAGAALAAEAWVDVVALDELTPGRGVAALVGGRQVAIFLRRQWRAVRGRQPRPLQRGLRAEPGHRRRPRRGPQGGLADVQAVASICARAGASTTTSVRIPVYPVRGRVRPGRRSRPDQRAGPMSTARNCCRSTPASSTGSGST